jgi:aspartate carbamoyltransferase regulatory subunit
MNAGDARALRKYIDEIEPGVDMSQVVKCPNPDCLTESTINMPLTMGFFYPDLK